MLQLLPQATSHAICAAERGMAQRPIVSTITKSPPTWPRPFDRLLSRECCGEAACRLCCLAGLQPPDGTRPVGRPTLAGPLRATGRTEVEGITSRVIQTWRTWWWE